MGIEVRPLGVRCNIGCQYCYQNPQRDAGNVARRYDMAAILGALEADPRPFSLFGGEALMVPLADLERLWAFGLDRHGGNTVQTNGTLIDDEHVAAFKRYEVRVGISIDGPGELNDARWAGTLARTRELTARTEAAIDRLLAEGVAVSLIVTLHRGNAVADALPRMHAWLEGLAGRGLRAARLHTLEVDDPAVGARWALAPDENIAALRSFAALERRVPGLRLDVFTDMKQMLRGRDARSACVFRACDPYTTEAVSGVEGDGQRSNCGRTNKDGVDFAKADQTGYERYVALHRTPQRDGGCRDCRFFLMCKGHCPGTAIDGDWRNRSEHCEVHKQVFVDLEYELCAAGERPLSLHPLRPQVEAAMVAAWARGRNPTIEATIREVLSKGTCSSEPDGKDSFARVSWVSDAARSLWAPRLERARRLIETTRSAVATPACCAAAQAALPAGHDPIALWAAAPGERAVEGPPELSPLLARIGLSVLEHVPCRPDCEASRELATRSIAALQARDAEATAWLLGALAWPVRWSALHGIAEIKTPVFKVCHDTAHTAATHALVRAGESWPEAGAQGVRAPFRAPPRRLVSDGARHRRGLEHAAGFGRRLPLIDRSAAPAIAWERLAEPQEDGYDSEALLRLADVRHPGHRAARLQALASARVRVCEGQVAVVHVGDPCPRGPDYIHGPVDHPVLARALALLERWPAVARQLPRIVHTISPMVEAARPEAVWPEVRGSGSTSKARQFGIVWVTTQDPAASAQALVHEMAHNKLFALGLDLESSARLIVNPVDRLYTSPIRTDRKRPMSAVFHAQYSFMHVTALDVAMLAGESDPAMRAYLAGLLARNIERMESGRREIEAHVETDAEGAIFVGAFLDWTARVLAAGAAALRGDREDG